MSIRCGKCPIERVCKTEIKMVSIVKDKSGKDRAVKVCPILWTLLRVRRMAKEEGEKVEKDEK